MTDAPTAIDVAAGTLALLTSQAEAMRTELARLRQELADAAALLASRDAERVRALDQQMARAAQRAAAVAALAGVHIGELVRVAGHQTGLEDAAVAAARDERLRQLRDANEKLVMAALTAQEIEAKAEQVRARQVSLLAIVAHELRNPLNPIRIAAESLKRAHSDEGTLGRLRQIIERQVAHMSRLIEDLLNVSAATAGRFQLARDSVALGPIITLAAESCRPTIDAKQQSLHLPYDAPPVMVHGDPVRLSQVFINLLENASKFTQAGGEISLAITPHADSVSICVADNGIGIEPDALEHVFELYVQAAPSTVNRSRGLGIGLAVVRELVEAHGGTVAARSAGRDRGSEFIVELPLKAPSAA